MRKIMMAAVATIALSATPLSAQQQSGLVNVNVSDISVAPEDVISRNNLDVQVPVGAVVQIPIGLAANVCGVAVGVLSAATGSAAACTAKSENTTRAKLWR